MAYAKSEKVMAGINVRKTAMITAAVEIAAKRGLDAVTGDAVAAITDLSVGLIYKYFADIVELRVKTIASLLERDMAAIRTATDKETTGLTRLATAVATLLGQLNNHNLVRARANSPIYQRNMRARLALLIGAATGRKQEECLLDAGAALGVIYGLIDLGGRRKYAVPVAVLFVLRGVGIGDAMAQRTVERVGA